MMVFPRPIASARIFKCIGSQYTVKGLKIIIATSFSFMGMPYKTYSSSSHLKSAWKFRGSITRKCIHIHYVTSPTFTKRPFFERCTKKNFKKKKRKQSKNRHTCLQDDKPPNKGEELSLHYLYIVPFLAGSSSKEPASGKGEVHTEVYQGAPFPTEQTIPQNFRSYRQR